MATNGTWVNGRRLFSPHALRDGDRVDIGTVTLVARVKRPRSDTVTGVAAPPPRFTGREREVLATLCRPVVLGNVLAGPTTVREMATMLSVSESAVKKALGRLYTKFALHGDERRRSNLALAAIRPGVGTHEVV